jgi:parallel beta-helix repeat protein
MKKINIVIMLGLVFLSPVIVNAKKCNVDGIGQEKKAYKTINESLSDSCQFIVLKPGKYIENIIIKDGVKISGVKNETIIEGSVQMDGLSGLKNVNIRNSKTKNAKGKTIGLKVNNNAKAVVHGIRVSVSNTGIETSKNSDLTIVNSVIVDNKKGFYIKRGTTIDIRNNEVINNKEEGIDVRAKIDGQISGNKITNNGESGIEIVMGGSNMKINNNIIRENHASGIALQFYRDNSELGNFLIAGNEIIKNNKYGLACKRPSGGKTPRQYWAKSTKFEYNKVGENKKGLIYDGCKFKNQKKWEVNKTKEDQKKLNEVLTEVKRDNKTMSEKEIVRVVNNRARDNDKSNQEDEWRQQAIDSKKKKEIDKIVDETEWNYNEIKEENEEVLEDTAVVVEFFLGPNKKVLKKLESNLEKHRHAMESSKEIAEELKTWYIKVGALRQIEKIEQHRELQEMYDKYNNKFGIWPWIKGLFQ